LTSPSRWSDRLLSLTLTVLAVAVMLHIAARLIVAVLPVLVGMGVVVLLGFAGWSFYRFQQSRW
jgi:xanthine/uracil permease